MVAVLVGMALVYFLFPKKDEEEALRTRYHSEDTGARRAPDASFPPSGGGSALGLVT